MIGAPSNTLPVGATGRLCQVDPRLPVTWQDGARCAPQGLALSLLAGPGAQLLLRVQSPGGGILSRRFTLPPGGAWLSLAGWGLVEVDVLTVGSPAVQCAYTLTRQAPPSVERLRLVEQLDTSGVLVPVPPGAVRLAPSVALGAWQWQTQAAPGPVLAIPAALAAGVFADVLGGGYVNAAPAVGCWELEGL